MENEIKYPQYYPELRNNFTDQKSQHFACDSMAVNFYCQVHGEKLQAVIKDDGNGKVTCVQEFKD